MDTLPILIVAAVYVSSRWRSHKFAITQLNSEQMKWVRRILGLSFFALGWLKIWNHDLIAWVADNYQSVMHDPLANFFAIGTDPQYPAGGEQILLTPTPGSAIVKILKMGKRATHTCPLREISQII
jgi:hypothetical protein